jgi:FtsH-binding integral membrane protein
MKEHIHIPQNHYSYQEHRRQFWLQIFLPMILAVLLIVVVAVITGISAFSNDNSSIWAAISTIWLVIPAMVFSLLFLVILAGLVYLLARGLQALPAYTSQAQYYANRAASEIKRFSDMAARPVIFLNSLAASLKAFFGKNY